jgi:hypothetical protein
MTKQERDEEIFDHWEELYKDVGWSLVKDIMETLSIHYKLSIRRVYQIIQNRLNSERFMRILDD